MRYNGRCHWGQYFLPNLDHEYLVNAYSEKSINSFITQVKKFDPDGLMSNEFTKKLGLTPNGEIYNNANFDFSCTDDEQGEGILMCAPFKKFAKPIWSSIVN